jgi:hypothetical protein
MRVHQSNEIFEVKGLVKYLHYGGKLIQATQFFFSRYENNGQRSAHLLEPSENFLAGHFRHSLVEHEQKRIDGVHLLKAFFAIPSRVQVPAFLARDILHADLNGLIIIGHEKFSIQQRIHLLPFRYAANAASRKR